MPSLTEFATITLNRPEARNGFTVRMSKELAGAVATAGDDDDVRVVVLTGSGADFCVGADLAGGSLEVTDEDINADDWEEPATRVVRPIFRLNKPVIAALRGCCRWRRVDDGPPGRLPAGLGQTAASDSCSVAEAFTRRRFGVVPARAWSVWAAPWTGSSADGLISADEALAAGLVTSLHEPDEVLAAAYALAA